MEGLFNFYKGPSQLKQLSFKIKANQDEDTVLEYW